MFSVLRRARAVGDGPEREMVRMREFRVVVATDGSPGGTAAVAVALAFPWPTRSNAQAVIARSRPSVARNWPAPAWAVVDERFDRMATAARRALRRRWPNADVVVLDKSPVEAVVGVARGAGAIVVGSRGYGALARLVMGSVSRGVVRRASCPTLVVRSRPRSIRRFALGLDGSANARRAVDLVARLRAPRGGRVTLVRALEPLRVGSLGVMPAGARGVLARQLAQARKQQVRRARRDLAAAAVVLKRAGWRMRTAIRWGIPLDEVLNAARETRADVLVVGVRGTGGVARLLLGSVAEGVLSRARVPVLVVR
jgi:nucleotide-binding universal stress UspA family protein